MKCNFPVPAWRTEDGDLFFKQRASSRALIRINLPCNHCIGCRLERARQWAVRCVHEAQTHDLSCFATLTYSNVHLPARNALDHRDFQLFMKSLRKLHNKANPGKKIRYYMAGEYGEDNARPHFHACLFGIDFTDKYPWRKNHQGDILYRSPTIEKIWHKGAVELGTVTLQSAGYVARYVLKKITGQHASTHYQRTDPATGELYTLPPEYNRMSLKPGIGANWFHQYKTDVYNGRNYLIHEGAKMAPPRYYHTLLERENKPAADAIKASRQHFERTRAPQNGTAREQIQKAAIRSLQRSLKETI